jgi:AcrR family transcriptional regulator
MRDYNPEATRRGILQGALEEFAAFGFEGASTRRIAARAKLSHGTIRYHFETKEKLWLAAVDYLFDRSSKEVAITDEEQKKLAEGDRLVFRAWLRRYVGYCARHPEHARIIYQETSNYSKRIEIVTEKYSQYRHMLATININALKNAGVFPKHASVASILYIIVGACQNIFALADECRLSFNHDPMTEEAVAAHAEAVADMICPLRD